MLEGKVTFSKLLQPSNALFDKSVTPDGMVTLSRLMQVLNALLPISVTPFGITMLSKDEQPENASPFILVTVLGNVSAFNEVHPPKVPQPMAVIPLFRFTVSKLLHPINIYLANSPVHVMVAFLSFVQSLNKLCSEDEYTPPCITASVSSVQLPQKELPMKVTLAGTLIVFKAVDAKQLLPIFVSPV